MRVGLKIFLVIVLIATLASGIWYYQRNKQSDTYNKSRGGGNNLNFIGFTERLGGIDSPKTYLVLFYNSMEMRPTGGFIGSFVIITIEKGQIKEQTFYDSGVFDSQLKNKPEAPFLIKKFLHTDTWGLRDSNWFFDFPTSAKKTMELYQLSDNAKKIDGVIGITTNILPYLLKKTGPITLDGIAGEFNETNCLEKLEYEVEQGFVKRGEKKLERKNTLKDLVDITLGRLTKLGKLDQLSMVGDIKDLLTKKDIQLFFFDEDMENYVLDNKWGGNIVSPQTDYLAVVDSNLGAKKTNRCLDYRFLYKVDLTNKSNPQAHLEITYKNNCKERDFMTDDYHGYLRIFIPQDSWLKNTEGFDKGMIPEITGEGDYAEISQEKDKKVFGNLVFVRLGEERKYTFNYNLPKTLNTSSYSLYFQKQAGMKNPQVEVVITDSSGTRTVFGGTVDRDTVIRSR